MKKILCQVEYSGKNFEGWQVQKRKGKTVRTVQGEIESALQKVLKQPIKTFVSGRTDALVNAKRQYFHFEANEFIAPERLPAALAHVLPSDISIKHAQLVESQFDARYSAKAKEYHYMCYLSNVREPLIDEFCLRLPNKLTIKKVKKAMKCFVGTHNFNAFYKKTKNTNYDLQVFNQKKQEVLSSNNLSKKQKQKQIKILTKKHTPIRKVHFFKLQKSGNVLTFKIKCNGFLHNMARIIIGTTIDVGLGKMQVGQVKRLLKNGKRSYAGKTIEAKALTLWEVFY